MSEDTTIPTRVKISDLKPYQNRFRVEFRVIEKSEEREVINRDNQEKHTLSNVSCADDTGSVILTAWDSDIQFLVPGKHFALTSGYVNLFGSSMRLARGRYGQIEELGAPPFSDVNMSNNRSNEEHQRRRRSFRRRSSEPGSTFSERSNPSDESI